LLLVVTFKRIQIKYYNQTYILAWRKNYELVIDLSHEVRWGWRFLNESENLILKNLKASH